MAGLAAEHIHQLSDSENGSTFETDSSGARLSCLLVSSAIVVIIKWHFWLLAGGAVFRVGIRSW